MGDKNLKEIFTVEVYYMTARRYQERESPTCFPKRCPCPVFCSLSLKLAFEMPANGLRISHSNIHELTSDDILSFSSKEYWHKFTLENGGLFDKELVLRAVLDSIIPIDLVPVKYTINGKDSYFLARNCGQAIEKFCLNLLLPIKLNNPPGEVNLSIQTCSVPINEYRINMQSHLKKAIERRYDETQKGFINLSSFHKEPGTHKLLRTLRAVPTELYEVLYCPLSKPKFLVYVLSILKKHFTITAINLSNNDIEIIKPLEVLHECKELISLDLSNNKIEDTSISELLAKTVPNLQILNLNGNPVCSKFKMELEYLKWIRGKNPSIKMLDGVLIQNGFPNQQVYLCSDKIWGIVDEFLQHYFSLYDRKRQALECTYEKNAIFSMTCDHSPYKDCKDSKLDCYYHRSRNLLKVNKNGMLGVSFHTNKTITSALQKLPLTLHDPYSFKVDVLFYEEPIIILVVSGLFKDFQETPRTRSFNRTFVIKRLLKDEFKITNDLYHITNASVEEVNDSFLCSKLRNERIESKSLLTKDEEENFIQVLSKLTEMNTAYSKKCLEDCNWDMKKALEVFLENYEAFNIPPEAFSEEFPM